MMPQVKTALRKKYYKEGGPPEQWKQETAVKKEDMGLGQVGRVN